MKDGDPDLALGADVGSGDRADERRRQGVAQALLLELARTDERESQTSILQLPAEARAKKLKELAPHAIRGELDGAGRRP